MATPGVFRSNYPGIGKMLRSETILGPGLLEIAEKVKAEAEATAPRDEGEFAESFRARLVTDRGDRSGARVAAQVFSTDPDGLHIETGAPRKSEGGTSSPKYRRPANTLSKALDVAGDD